MIMKLEKVYPSFLFAITLFVLFGGYIAYAKYFVSK